MLNICRIKNKLYLCSTFYNQWVVSRETGSPFFVVPNVVPRMREVPKCCTSVVPTIARGKNKGRYILL
jgi:hypothetical protein